MDNGHRTSTPNMSKRKRSSSMSAPELKQLRKQIEDLEKMYFEILRIIDPDKQSNFSRTSAQSSTSLSSYSNASSNKDTSKRGNQHRSRQRNQQQQRNSFQQRSFSSQPNQNQNSQGSDMKFVSFLFNFSCTKSFISVFYMNFVIRIINR